MSLKMYKSSVIYTKEDVLTMLLKHITDGFDEKVIVRSEKQNAWGVNIGLNALLL